MEQSALEMLKRCYAGSRDPVVLADQNWQILWQNYPLEIGCLPSDHLAALRNRVTTEKNS